MKYIRSTPNPSGAYPAPQSNPFPGCLSLTDEQTAVLVQYNGFVTITNEPDEEAEGASVMVTPDLEAWEEWKANLPPEPEPDPTVEEILNAFFGMEEGERDMDKITVNGSGGGVIPPNSLTIWEVAA